MLPSFQQLNRMICVSRGTLVFFCGAREYLKHINGLFDENYVVMEYEKEVYLVPLCHSVNVFMHGGVFVNE